WSCLLCQLSYLSGLCMLVILSHLYKSSFFFFQAEDGIRDRNVTGVQTCALPISMFYAISYFLIVHGIQILHHVKLKQLTKRQVGYKNHETLVHTNAEMHRT